MKHGYRVVSGLAFALVLLVQGQVRAEAVYVDAADDHSLMKLAQAPTGVTTSLSAGWHLISLPVMPADASLTALFPDAISAYSFTGSGYERVSGLETCEGYWLNLLTGGDYQISGVPVGECVGTRPEGWSLIGVPKGGTTVGAIVHNPVDNSLVLWGYAGAFALASNLEEGAGYWLHMDQPGTVTLQGGMGKVAADVRREVVATGSQLVIESAGHALTLDLGAAAGLMVALPPTPPAGAFDARAEVNGVATQTVPASAQPMDYRVRVQGTDLMLRWDVAVADGNQWQLLVDGTTYQLSGTGSLSLAAAPEDMWLRYTPTVPGQFALLENYPNPFNPSTTIRYDLAASVNVSLVIYDVLGQRVRQLVDLRQPGGSYSVVWDGRNGHGQQVANGVYFYEIKAGDFHGTRKMMLTK
jgi:hypothetical protein